MNDYNVEVREQLMLDICNLFEQIQTNDPSTIDSTFGKYMVGCIYDINWEGFDTEHLQGIMELLTDMELFVRYDDK